MRISDLSNLHETRVVTIDGTPYTVESLGEFETDETGTASCETGRSLGRLHPDPLDRHLAVDRQPRRRSSRRASSRRRTARSRPKAARSRSRSTMPKTTAIAGRRADRHRGRHASAGVTGANGCAIFGNLPGGELHAEPLGADAGRQRRQTAGAAGDQRRRREHQHGGPPVRRPGAVSRSNFETRVGGKLVPSSADAVVVFNSGMQLPKAFGTPGDAAAAVTATPLFPFTSPYAVYAGSCDEQRPHSTGRIDAAGNGREAVVSANGTTEVTIELPACT